MPNPITSKKQIQKMAADLHKSGAINLNTSLSDILKANPSGPISDNVVAWSEYVLITNRSAKAGLSNVKKVADRVRGPGG